MLKKSSPIPQLSLNLLKSRYLISLASNTRADIYRIFSVFLLFFVLACAPSILYAQEDALEQKLAIEPQRATIYELLGKVTEATGFYFIYDSKIVDSDKSSRITSKSKTLKQTLNEVLDDDSLDYKIIEKHILIFKRQEQQKPEHTIKNDSIRPISIKGQVLDKATKKPLPFVTIAIMDRNIGTISNFDGFFSLKLNPQYLNSSITVSHLGYKSQHIPIKALKDQKVDILLETEYISIQEVIIRNIDAKEVINKFIASRLENYPRQPIYLTSFYREGVLKDRKYLNYSEAIIKILKSPLNKSFESDQIKLLQSRKVINVDQHDTLIVKIKSGLQSSLTLDIVKNLPDFLDPDFLNNYSYTKADIVPINSRNAYAIAFEQNDNVYEPLYKGTLYIDMETYALVNADFEINPKYVKNADDMFVLKKSRKYSVIPEKISYNVSYNLSNGRYYINHIRGDLHLNYKRRFHLLSNNFHVFLELASCEVDTTNVHRFSRDEVLKTNTVFLDSKFKFDETYWGDYNIISPEEKISQALSRINAKMEVVKPE